MSNRLSVFRVDGLNSDEILDLGIRVALLRGGTTAVHGWVEFCENGLREKGLNVIYDEDPPRHAHVVEWPKDAGDRVQIERELAHICHRKAMFESPIGIDGFQMKTGFACSFVSDIVK